MAIKSELPPAVVRLVRYLLIGGAGILSKPRGFSLNRRENHVGLAPTHTLLQPRPAAVDPLDAGQRRQKLAQMTKRRRVVTTLRQDKEQGRVPKHS